MSLYNEFYQLHHQPTPFLLANAWNAKSAQLIEKVGFRAMGTSSGAIADSLGYPDGEKIPFDEMLYIIKRIKASTTIPLSVDFERGYGSDVSVITQRIEQLLDAGVAGINIEDAEGEDVYLRKLEGIKNFMTKTGRQLFINSRTDVFLQKLPSPVETVIKRAGLYKAAGADGLFVTGVGDPDTIKEITSAVDLPVNIVGNANLSKVAAFADMGVKRISMAVFMYRAAYNYLEKVSQEIMAGQSVAPLF